MGNTVTDEESVCHFLTHSWHQVNCYGKPVERTSDIGLEIMMSLVRSAGFPKQLIGLHDRVRKWIWAFICCRLTDLITL